MLQFAALLFFSSGLSLSAHPHVTAAGHDSRIDLVWDSRLPAGTDGWRVYRAKETNGLFNAVNSHPQTYSVFSDYFGENGRTFFYRVTELSQGREISTSAVVSATSRAMSDDDLLTSVQEATFRYFWQYAHPESGLAREQFDDSDKVTIGGSGFGMMAIVVGAERGFVSREAAAARILKMLTFLENNASSYHGAWPHWLDGRTGATIPFSSFDDGGDLVETSFLIQGMLTAGQYFHQDNPTENEIRKHASRLWQRVEWDWYLGEPRGEQLFWHWSPTNRWKMNQHIGGQFNECLITYLLALASPTHPIPQSSYQNGWIGKDPSKFLNGKSSYGLAQPVGQPSGGPLFFTQYSFLGFDPRFWSDPYGNYFQNNRAISQIHHAYAVANPAKHSGYSDKIWGLTASQGPRGYNAFAPLNDDGTIAPTAALSAMPYTPQESLLALKEFYHGLGKKLWGDFGFKDAFNLSQNWVDSGYLAIDEGPIVVMIENYRTGLCWRWFMANPEIPRMLKQVGWKQNLQTKQ